MNTSQPIAIWEQIAWKRASTDWIENALADLGLKQTGRADPFHVRDWSIVIRIPTDEGNYFFKAGSESQLFEAGFLQAMAGKGFNSILLPVASDPERGWMLFEDGGLSLREIEEGKQSHTRWSAMLGDFALLQIEMAKQKDVWLSSGLPDRRLEKLKAEYQQLLTSPELLPLSKLGAMPSEEVGMLHDKQDEFSALIDELAAFKIPPSVDHGDLHDGNVFFRNGKALFFDWGDASFTQPFISLMIPLRMLGNYLELEPETHSELEWARQAYLAPWMDFMERDDLNQAWEIALHIGRFHRAMNWYKVAQESQGPEKKDHAESFVGWLREFIYHPEDPPD